MSISNLQVLVDIFKQETEGINLAAQLTFLAIEAVIFFGFWITIGKKKNIFRKRLLVIYLLLAYLEFLFSITVFRRPWGSREGIVHLYIRLGFGLRTGHPSFRISAFSIYNMILFLPFGVLAGMAMRAKSRLKGIIMITVIGACLSLLIECVQLFTGRGMFEVTDLITNTTGGFIGALIYESIAGKQVSVS